MNNRDPFNVRLKSPRSPLQVVQSNDFFSQPSSTTTQQVPSAEQRPHTRQVSNPAATSLQPPVDGGFSIMTTQDHSISHNGQPNGWRPRRATSGRAPSLSEKFNSIISHHEDEELPMYKDKPYNYSSSQRKRPFYRRRNIVLAFTAICFVFLYFSGLFSRLPAGKRFEDAAFKRPLTLFSGSKASVVDWDERRERVRDAFQISWEAYEKHAWGFDEFHPKSQTGRQMVPNGMGWIIIDALDTLMIMNLTTQLAHAREWLSTTLSFDQDHDVNTFETTIRMLGGLLGAHYLSSTYPDMAPLSTAGGNLDSDLYLEKATDLADRLLGAYESKTGIPYASVNLKTREGIPSHEDGGASSTAEAASLQLEMKYLAKLTGERNYWDSAEKIMQIIDDNGMQDGLLPVFIYAEDGTFRGNNIRLGSRGDSYYEYLIKQYLQTSRQEPVYQELWDQALEGVQKHLITYTRNSNLTVLGERPNGLDGPLSPKMDHLVCFMPSAIALGATGGKTLEEARKSETWGKKQEGEIELARQLLKTCWGMYQVTATGLSPEIAHFRIHDPPIMMKDGIPESPSNLSQEGDTTWRMDYDIHIADFHNLQRPETVESLLYMWRITGDETYREWGWQMFESFVKYTALPNYGGFSSIENVDHIPTAMRDSMESFWLAETLKYLYLLFGPNDVLPLDSNVFNTEAHPLPTFELGKLFSTGWQRKPRDRDGNLLKAQNP